jgi:hypothetical protein
MKHSCCAMMGTPFNFWPVSSVARDRLLGGLGYTATSAVLLDGDESLVHSQPM